jgi:hypothetical protein
MRRSKLQSPSSFVSSPGRFPGPGPLRIRTYVECMVMGSWPPALIEADGERAGAMHEVGRNYSP